MDRNNSDTSILDSGNTSTNQVESFEFDESDSTQLKSLQFGRRRRVAYGKRSGVPSNSSRSFLNDQLKTFGSDGQFQNDKVHSTTSGRDKVSNFAVQKTTGQQDCEPSRSAFRRSLSLPGVGSRKDKLFDQDLTPKTVNCNYNENAHPNLMRRESMAFVSSSSSTCFSSISRSASGQGSIASTTTNTTNTMASFSTAKTSDSNEVGSLMNNYASPARGNTSFSRKRGVCESPIVCPDDQVSNGGTSSSYGSRRARSRIFSPDSTKKMIEASLAFDTNDLIPIPKESVKQRNGVSFNESDTEEEDQDTSMRLLSNSIDIEAIDDDAEDCPNENSIDLGVPPSMMRRTSSVGSTFEEAIFAPVESKQGTRAHEQVFAHMSCYDDLKFLIRELRKWNSGHQAVVFGSIWRLCTIVPPRQWGHQRKIAFHEWATTHLGFCHKSGGGMVSYLQTSQSNGKHVLKTLEAALLSYKESSKSDRLQQSRKTCVQPRLPISSIKLMRRSVSTPMIPSLKKMSLTSPGFLPNVRPSLSRSFRQTPMSVDKPSPMTSAVGYISSKLEAMEILDNKNDNPMDSEEINPTPRFSNDTSEKSMLQRIVTLPSEEKISMGRPSHDNSFTHTGDFMSQIGVSPRVNTTEHLRPTSLMLSIEKNVNPIHAMSPCVESNHILTIDSCVCVETPMPKYDYRNWGSRPLKGKDWGVSARCDQKVIKDLYEKLERRIATLIHGHEIDTVPYYCEEQVLIKDKDGSPTFSRESFLPHANSSALAIGSEFDATHSSDNSEDDVRSCHDDSTFMPSLDIKESNEVPRMSSRRQKSIAKRTRVSICESSLASPRPFRLSSIQSRQSFLRCENSSRPKLNVLQTLEESSVSRVNVPSIFDIQNQEDIYEKFWSNQNLMLRTFSFLSEYDLLCSASLVSTSWADVATHAHASLMLISVGCSASFAYSEDTRLNEVKSDDEDIECKPEDELKAFAQSMKRSWDYLVTRFPWGSFLSEGAFKRVYKVWNTYVGAEEAISVMNIDQIDNVNVVGSELAVSVMLSSLVRRKICPNFVSVRGMFTSEYEPSVSIWGCASNKAPQGIDYNVHRTYKKPRKPSNKKRGSFQYIRMELCRHGDLEEYIKRQPGSVLSPCDSRAVLFQMAFSLHVAGNKFGMKHYDVKLLNFFVDDTNDANVDPNKYPYTVLQYGLGSHIFNVRMKTRNAITVKLADFGTANMRADSNGQPVLIGNFTTLENTPPDYLILGDSAVQGYAHDCFGLGLCMLHLFTGYAPYEEIMESVHCPPNLKRKLKSIWESKKPNGYEVIKNVIRCDVLEDDDGNIIDGFPDDTLYDTFYRFLVLFGIPTERFECKDGSRVWGAIDQCIGFEDLSNATNRSRRNISSNRSRKKGPDYAQYMFDCDRFSMSRGDNEHIARARGTLKRFNGGMDLLLSLVAFDPKKRASPLDVMNSKFMEALRDGYGSSEVANHDIVHSFLSFKTL